jgi:hypothetical protein
MLRVATGLLAALFACASLAEQFRTPDPLKAFVHEEYPWGDDFFIHGNQDTYIFRCLMSKKTDGFDGIALSEISIWGNHGGPWEIFKKTGNGDYAYAGAEALPNTSCLEWCRSKEYLSSGQCRWRRGWPKQ